MAWTQAIFYRDGRGREPVDEFIEALPAKRAAKIDAHIDEHLNGRAELRELRIRFANTRYRLLYQRSDNLIVLLHTFEKNTGTVPAADKEIAKRRIQDFKRRMEQAGTSHSFISKVEGGEHIPTIPVLKRILAVLDEELLIGVERRVPDGGPEREVAPAPSLAAA